MRPFQDTSPAAQALVVRPNPSADQAVADRYLLITPAGAANWIEDPARATTFASMREAARVALRLPARLRAFGLPREPELAVRSLH